MAWGLTSLVVAPILGVAALWPLTPSVHNAGYLVRAHLATQHSPDNGFVSKVQEAELALKLDESYSKNEILRLYLADVYFGHGFYGLPAAAVGYFGVTPAQLSWAQASMLAGLVQAPSAYDPIRHLSTGRLRQHAYSSVRLPLWTPTASMSVGTPERLTSSVAD